ncbi:MAG: DNA polymerase III subunit delta [Tenericutes bacterium HGW-Tenericutes-1]|jgi:DNA polymerase-3 subunit delta|nr:MAG: DNA polymerase III subunit delta [Tenericutes bacterium HGW-Tenericutes-1]
MGECLYLFHGDNSHLIKFKTEQLFENKKIDVSDIEVFDMEETLLVDAVNAAMTIPFLSDNKGVILANASFLTANTKSDNETENQLKYLSNYLSNPNPTTILVIQAPYEKLDQRKPIYKDCQSFCVVEQCLAPNKDDHYSFVKRRIEQEKMIIDANALEEFITRVSENSFMLANELDKLILYADGKSKIDLNTVREVTIKNLESKIYTLVNAVVSKDQWSISSIYQDLMRVNTEPVTIVTLLAFKFQEILYTQALLRMKSKQEDIMKYFSATKGRAYYIIKNATDISESSVMQYLTELEQLDYLMKSGQVDKKIGLEMFLFKPDNMK